MTTTKTDIEPLVYDLGEAARALRLGYSTVRALVAIGKLRTVKIGDRRLVTKAEMARFLEECAAAA